MTHASADIDAFISAPLRLAALLNSWRRHQPTRQAESSSHSRQAEAAKECESSISKKQKTKRIIDNEPGDQTTRTSRYELTREALTGHGLCGRANWLLVVAVVAACALAMDTRAAHAQLIIPRSAYFLDSQPVSTHFQYADGRQSRSLLEAAPASEDAMEFRSASAKTDSQNKANALNKRSSVALVAPGPPTAQHLPLVSSMHMLPYSVNGLTRRSLLAAAAARAEPSAESLSSSESMSVDVVQQAPANYMPSHHNTQRLARPQMLIPFHTKSAPLSNMQPDTQEESQQQRALLRQKQHIQYHDQWLTNTNGNDFNEQNLGAAAKCHKRTLNFCASVLPFNTTTFPNIIGDTNRFQVKRSLPFFGFLAKSSCNKRLDELLCLLLEPPCNAHTGVAIPPCKKFCRLALEGCNEYIPATLALSSVFDCRQYPDSSDPSECVNMAQGSKCSQDEFRCPDETCIPRNWLCDGVRDCLFAADEANCTEINAFSAGSPSNPSQASGSSSTSQSNSGACSSEEFKCDAKCVPKAWRCDGERDCLDGTDEEDCERRPRCGADRFKCADGNGCIPKRWVCDGKAECRDGSDEMNCSERECSQNDFKCDNGICIPNLWRCDRQFDCKDGSDERGCVYLEPTTSSTSTTTTTTTTSSPPSSIMRERELARVIAAAAEYANVSASSFLSEGLLFGAGQAPVAIESPAQADSSEQPERAAPVDASPALVQQQQQEQLESNLGHDVARIIQRESNSLTTVDVAGGAGKADATYDLVMAPPSPSQQHAQPSTTSGANATGATDGKQHRAQSSGGDGYSVMLTQQAPQVSSSPESAAAHGQQQSNQSVSSESVASSEQQQQVPSTSTPANNSNNNNNNDNDHQLLQEPSATQQNQHNHNQNQRIPIYRNLLKSLKGGPGQLARRPASGALQQQPQNAQASVVSVPSARRRRERNQLMRLQAAPASPSMAAGRDLPRAASHASGGQQPQPGQDSAQARGAHFQANNTNGTSAAGARASTSVSGSVATYLQLLNNRYHHLLSNRVHHS